MPEDLSVITSAISLLHLPQELPSQLPEAQAATWAQVVTAETELPAAPAALSQQLFLQAVTLMPEAL
jgi:hypothetical protein